jgi:L-ascorbate metabolism protein UlaG (beta-lactamase superfamily)
LQSPFELPAKNLEYLEILRPGRIPDLRRAGSLRELLRLSGNQAEQLAMLLGEPSCRPPDRHMEAGGRIRHLGQACLVLQSPAGAVLTDPFISADSAEGDAGERFAPADLPDFIDLVLITHGRQENIVLETLLQLRGRIGEIVVPSCGPDDPEDPSLGAYLSRLGFPVVEADAYDEFAFTGGTVVATPFIEDGHGGRGAPGKSTYWVELAGRSIFIGAESSGADPVPYICIRQHLGPAHFAFLGMNCDGATATRHCPSRAEQAAMITAELGAAEAYVYAISEDPWLGHVLATPRSGDTYLFREIDQFITWCADREIRTGHLLGQQECSW